MTPTGKPSNLLPVPSAPHRIAMRLLPLAGIASLLSGSIFWLRRVGWLQPEKYWFTNTALAATSPNPSDDAGVHAFVTAHHDSLHQLDGWLVATKYAKEAVLAAFLLLAVSQLMRVRPPRGFGVAYADLFLLGALSAATTAFTGAWFALLAGARSFAAWLIGLGVSPLLDEAMLRRTSRVFTWVFLAQVVLALIEFRRGMQIYTIYLFEQDFIRVVGSFNLPVSLGTFSVVAWALACCWGGYSRRTLAALSCLLAIVLVMNGSATSWMAWAATATVMHLPRLARRWRIAFLLATLPAAMLAWSALPALTGRYDVHDSLWGRIAPVQAYAETHLSTRQVLFGTGFGIGTNALVRTEGTKLHSRRAMPDWPIGDSLPAALFWQVGLVGMAFAYALFALALRTDERARPIGIAILVSSVGVNVTELFPVNLILAFWLANAARQGSAHAGER